MVTRMIGVVDYGMGNVGSLLNMFRKLGVAAQPVTTAEQVAESPKIILPGVGAFDQGMTLLNELGLLDSLNSHALEHRRPVLGICLGMQLLGRTSEEGSLPGLGWIPADTVRIRSDQNPPLRIPHMGWNNVEVIHRDGVWHDADEDPRFYFIHSYHVKCDDDAIVSARCHYGKPLTAALRMQNIHGTQFHPEKSHRFGLGLLTQFARSC